MLILSVWVGTHCQLFFLIVLVSFNSLSFTFLGCLFQWLENISCVLTYCHTTIHLLMANRCTKNSLSRVPFGITIAHCYQWDHKTDTPLSMSKVAQRFSGILDAKLFILLTSRQNRDIPRHAQKHLPSMCTRSCKPPAPSCIHLFSRENIFTFFWCATNSQEGLQKTSAIAVDLWTCFHCWSREAISTVLCSISV